jgi:phospholipid/cholesterol/gamma-HCH transport system permease protein
MGFDPVRWLVVPRCLALVATLPLLTWFGDLLALIGGLAVTTAFTRMTARAYLQATAESRLTGLAMSVDMVVAYVAADRQALAAMFSDPGKFYNADWIRK